MTFMSVCLGSRRALGAGFFTLISTERRLRAVVVFDFSATAEQVAKSRVDLTVWLRPEQP
jgi:hypothetical protein